MKMNSYESGSRRLCDSDGKVLDRIIGFETEYALNVISSRAHIADTAYEARALETDPELSARIKNGWLAEDLTRMAVRGRGEFSEAGDRHYVDIGNHPEYAGPENIDFLAAAHHLLYGHLKVSRYYANLASRLAMSSPKAWPIQEVNLYANTTTGVISRGEGNSWASHTNILTRRALLPNDYILPLATHHAARPVWSGAGLPVVNPSGKYQYTISEKAPFIWEVASEATTRSRPLVNLRDEPLADPTLYRRIHDVSGEANFNPLILALRPALDSLILRACEVGEDFDDLLLDNPVRAIRTVSNDLSLRKPIRLANGKTITALDLEVAIIDRALTKATRACNVTDQETAYANRCLGLLATLAVEPLQTKVDWVIKYKLIEKELAVKKEGQTDIAVALQKAAEYHRLLPNEGYAMRLVRKGYFPDSPSASILSDGPPMPDTRAKLRGHAIQAITMAGLTAVAEASEADLGGGWDRIRVPEYRAEFLMPDPYETGFERFEAFLAKLLLLPS